MTQKFIPQKHNLGPIAWVLAAAAVLLGAAFGFVIPYIDNPAILLVLIAAIPVVVLTIMYPDYGLMFMIFITYSRLSDSLEKYMGLPSIFVPFLALLIVVILVRWWLYNEIPKGFAKSFILLGLYALVVFSSLLYARNYSAAYYTFVEMLKSIVVAAVIILLLRKPQSLRLVIWSLVASGILMGTISVYQYFTGTFDNPYWGFGRAQIQNIVSGQDDYRLGGSVGDPNFYAQILLVIVPLALDRVWTEKILILRLLAAWSLAVTTLTIVLTFSRGALLGLIAIGIIIFIRKPPKLPALIMTILLIIPLIQFVPESYTERISTLTEFIPGLGSSENTDPTSEVSYRGRISEMLIGIYMFEDYPLIGVGAENYPSYYQEYSRQLGLDPRLEERHPHSLYIQIAAEHGLMGLFVFGLLVSSVFRDLVKAERRFKRLGYPDEADMSIALATGILGYFVTAIFLHLAYPRFFWILVGLAFASANIVKQELRQRKQIQPVQTEPS